MKAIRRWLQRSAVSREPALRVLMVCSGNICRSPTAEGVLRSKLRLRGLGEQVAVDSAGTLGVLAKSPPDPRAQAQAERRGYDLSGLRARRVTGEDFLHFDRILAMDESHIAWLQRAAPPQMRSRLELLMTHALLHADCSEVPDPYYGSEKDFERMLDLVEDACEGLVQQLATELHARGALGGMARNPPNA